MKHWWKRNSKVDLGSYTQDIVEDLTGSIPLLLDKCVMDGEINLFADALQTVFREVRAFIIDINQTEKDPAWGM